MNGVGYGDSFNRTPRAEGGAGTLRAGPLLNKFLFFIFHQEDGKLLPPNAEETELGRRGEGRGDRDRIYRIDKIKGGYFLYSISRHPVNPVNPV